MSERAAELWERGQELDGSAEELWKRLVESSKERNWNRETIRRRLDEDIDESDTAPHDLPDVTVEGLELPWQNQ